LSTDFSTKCAPNFFQNTDILITLGTSAENKRLECTIAYNKSEVGFQIMLFYINFDTSKLHNNKNIKNNSLKSKQNGVNYKIVSSKYWSFY